MVPHLLIAIRNQGSDKVNMWHAECTMIYYNKVMIMHNADGLVRIGYGGR